MSGRGRTADGTSHAGRASEGAVELLMQLGTWKSGCLITHTVDGRNPANQVGLVVYPIIYKVLAPSQVFPGGAGFLPSTGESMGRLYIYLRIQYIHLVEFYGFHVGRYTIVPWNLWVRKAFLGEFKACFFFFFRGR